VSAGILAMLMTSSLSELAGVSKPNILFVVTDDQDAKSVARMPELQAGVADEGATFSNARVTTNQCCPSRATILRGQYAHNHQVWDNGGPNGGFDKFRSEGLESSTIATWLDGAGYDTGYVGKYFNGYDGTRYVPPGWDKWWTRLGGNSGDSYEINANGEIKSLDRSEVLDTDFYAHTAQRFVESHTDKPWFLVVATSAPHSPSWSAKRHDGMFSDADMPKPPSFNEEDVSDKPKNIRDNPHLDAQGVNNMQKNWRQRMRSLQAVDDLVGHLVSTLGETGQLENTYIVFTSDNGWGWYQNRVRGKGPPYEGAARVPLIVRGPGVPNDTVRDQLVANIDLAPTIADWVGIGSPEFVDGRSFDPLLSESPPQYRGALLVEFSGDSVKYTGIRTSAGELYVEYPRTGEKELYDLESDPYQLNNAYEKADPALIADLEARLEVLKGCAREECRKAENNP
jgi:N-acetylglucosamine-6-sulfatase